MEIFKATGHTNGQMELGMTANGKTIDFKVEGKLRIQTAIFYKEYFKITT